MKGVRHQHPQERRPYTAGSNQFALVSRFRLPGVSELVDTATDSSRCLNPETLSRRLLFSHYFLSERDLRQRESLFACPKTPECAAKCAQRHESKPCHETQKRLRRSYSWHASNDARTARTSTSETATLTSRSPRSMSNSRPCDSKPRLHAMVALLIYSGLRREEIVWLQREDVDFRRAIREVELSWSCLDYRHIQNMRVLFHSLHKRNLMATPMRSRWVIKSWNHKKSCLSRELGF